MPSLQGLSADLLHLICEYCTSNCLQELRLTCRELHAIATNHYLPEVVTCLEANGLRTVHAIAESSELIRNGVKSFVMQVDGFDVNMDTKEDIPCPLLEWLDIRADFLYRPVHASREVRNIIRHLQQLPKNTARVTLCDALQFFQSGSEAMFQDKDFAWDFHRRYEASARAPRKLESTVIVAMRTLFAACPKISSLTVNFADTLRRNAGLTNQRFLRDLNIPHGGPQVMRDLSIIYMLSCAYKAGLKIRALSISGAKPSFLNISPRNPKMVVHLSAQHKLIQHVQRLHLVFNGSEGPPESFNPALQPWANYEDPSSHKRSLVKWLQCCALLRELRLEMPPGWRFDLRDMLESVRLPRLKLLHLVHFKCTEEEMGSCLLQYQETLQVLELANVHLPHGVWPCCLSTIAGKFEQLRAVKTTGTFTCVGPLGEHQYYLGDGAQSAVQVKQRSAMIEEYILSGVGPAPDWPLLTLEEMWGNLIGRSVENVEVDSDGEISDSSEDLCRKNLFRLEEEERDEEEEYDGLY